LKSTALVSCSNNIYGSNIIIGVYIGVLDEVAVGYHAWRCLLWPIHRDLCIIWIEVIYGYILTPAALVSCFNHKCDSTAIRCMYSDVLDEVSWGCRVLSTQCVPHIGIWSYMKYGILFLFIDPRRSCIIF